MRNTDIHTEECVHTCFEKNNPSPERKITVGGSDGEATEYETWKKGQDLNKWKRGHSRKDNVSEDLEVGANTHRVLTEQ